MNLDSVVRVVGLQLSSDITSFEKATQEPVARCFVRMKSGRVPAV